MPVPYELTIHKIFPKRKKPRGNSKLFISVCGRLHNGLPKDVYILISGIMTVLS